MSGPAVGPEDLAELPEQCRRTVARWLVQRADALRPSWVASPATVLAVRDGLAGAAVDLADPLAEDSTTGHAAGVLAALRADPNENHPPGVDPFTPNG